MRVKFIYLDDRTVNNIRVESPNRSSKSPVAGADETTTEDAVLVVLAVLPFGVPSNASNTKTKNKN